MTSETPDMFSEIHQFRPIAWLEIPDLGLYADQVITLIGRSCQAVYAGDVKSLLSPSMINNYVKARLIPRPEGKKYSRQQVALLSMIVLLKPVCSMEDIRRLLTLKDGQTVESLYETFRSRFCEALQSLRIDEGNDLDPALDFAIRAAGYRLGCDAALREREQEPE